MSSNVVAELDTALQAMQDLKAPGVSGSRIQSITTLCTNNIQDESAIITKLYQQVKRSKNTHKLGVLYVVDSVTRKWSEQAKAQGQTINSDAQDGTFAAGVHKVKDILPALMNDVIKFSPLDQKEKIKKLVDIWEKGQTFPLPMLVQFKQKLKEAEVESQNHHIQSAPPSTTPPGSPPPFPFGMAPTNNTPPAPAANTSSILAALANIARTQQPAAVPNTQPQENSYIASNAQSNHVQQNGAVNSAYPPVPPPVNMPAPVAYAQQPQLPQVGSNGVQNYHNQNNQFTGAQPIVPQLPQAQAPAPAALDPATQQQIAVIKALAAQGLNPEQIVGILTAMGTQALPPPPPPAYGVVVPPPFVAPAPDAIQNGWGSNSPATRDNGPSYRSPRDGRGQRDRSRSRSPVRGGWNRDSPNRRENVDAYGRDISGRGRDMDRPAGYRERSPPRRAQSLTPPGSSSGPAKWIGHDTTIGDNKIKVLSRTLFVGGVNSSDRELRSVFECHGRVQTCIVNKDKRHAFVKMISREDAVNAKEQMEKNRSPDSQLRTRWGVGFGPRDCCDYQTGVSIIPIHKLTEADKKWILTAEYGGTGGMPIRPGMVVEEPDIEIGQGVSSKAISRRMQTDRGGNNGPKSTRDREEEEAAHRNNRRDERRDDKWHDRRDRSSKVQGPPSMPAVPAFGMNGFSFPMLPNGQPMFPPGFSFPGQNPPGPPGRS